MNAGIPSFEARLPALSDFVRALAGRVDSGSLRDDTALDRHIGDFCTRDRLASIEVVAPGWQAMASFAGGATLRHVVRAMIALQQLPEYRKAGPDLRAMLEWSVFHHDLGKQAVGGSRDSLHAFRSAALAARALPSAGFATAPSYAEELEPWVRLVLDAFVPAPAGEGFIQDNRAVPRIVAGSERLFGAGSAAALIVQAVLLHQSLNVVAEWPNAAGLSEREISACISPALLPLLEGVMLVDSDAWQLLDAPLRAHFRQSTLAAFAEVRRLVGT